MVVCKNQNDPTLILHSYLTELWSLYISRKEYNINDMSKQVEQTACVKNKGTQKIKHLDTDNPIARFMFLAHCIVIMPFILPLSLLCDNI